MKEILGNNLEQFFNSEIIGKRTYKGNEYEVWEVSDETFDVMCDMTEEEFVNLSGENAWWRSAEGSNLGAPNTKVHINDYELLGWIDELWEYSEEEDEEDFEIYASSLSNYLGDVIGVSQPRNVCAIAVDLARYNNMTMGELFTKCEG